MPKRKHEEQDSSADDPKDPRCSTSSDSSNDEPEKKRARKSVNFEDVHVFYFNRTQGFVCVPSQGGTTLGMSDKHQSKEVYKMSDYLRRRKMLRRRRQSKEAAKLDASSEPEDDDIAEEHVSDASGVTDGNSCSFECVDTKADENDDDDEEEISSNAFILPVPVRRRRMMLRLSGVRKIDATERSECQEIRQSREYCGCTCQVFCDPDTCECSQDGIQCQVDRMHFPCGCTREGCSNKAGRIEFNPARVRTHYVHTIMRLELEKQLADSKSSSPAHLDDVVPSPLRRHIRFNDEGEPADQHIPEKTGELVLFNSDEQGSCRECSHRPDLVAESAADAYLSRGIGCASPAASLGDDFLTCLPGASSQLSVKGVVGPCTCGFRTQDVFSDGFREASNAVGCHMAEHTDCCAAFETSAAFPGPSSELSFCIAPLTRSVCVPGKTASDAVSASMAAADATASTFTIAESHEMSVSDAAIELRLPAIDDFRYAEAATNWVQLPHVAELRNLNYRSCPAVATWCHCSSSTSEARPSGASAASTLSSGQDAIQPASWPLPPSCSTAASSAVLSRKQARSLADAAVAAADGGGGGSQRSCLDVSSPSSPVDSSFTSLVPLSDGSVGSSNLCLSFQRSSSESLYADASTMLANFCEQGAYPSVGSSRETADQDAVPFTNLTESVFETVSA